MKAKNNQIRKCRTKRLVFDVIKFCDATKDEVARLPGIEVMDSFVPTDPPLWDSGVRYFYAWNENIGMRSNQRAHDGDYFIYKEGRWEVLKKKEFETYFEMVEYD